MSAKGNSKHHKTQPRINSTPPANIDLGRLFIVMALVILLLVIGVVWASPGINIDLLTSLAGGRDVTAGHLGRADNWSFITSDRVWLDQNWGSGLIYYLCQKALGYNGLLWLKALLIAACALFSLLAARRRQVSWSVALLATALVMISIRNYLYMRPNVMTLIFAPLELWLLYRSLERPSRIWLVAGIMLLWANLHGGFIFGLGVMALWTACPLLVAVISGEAEGFKKYWQPIAATAVGVLLAGFANPFGLANLTHPFLILGENYWRNVAEWQPIFGANFDLTHTWEFFAIIGGILFLCLRRMIKTLKHRLALSNTPPQKEPMEKPTGTLERNTGVILFELILCLVSVLMAFTSRRFIPLALILLIPVLAIQIGWFLTQLRHPKKRYRPQWAVLLLGMIVLLLTYGQMNRVLRYYQPQNPLSTPEPFFDKMNLAYHFFPASLAQFVNDNQIAGNVFSNWEWEGYLHWKCPQLKLFVGSRAQQVYRVSEYKLYSEILTSQSPADELKRLKIPIVACSYSGVFTDFINRLITGGQWVCIFNDNYHCLLVDLSWDQGRLLAERVRQNRLTFSKPAIGLLSRASYILSPGVDEDRSQAIGIIKQAVNPRPLSKGYQALANFILTESDQTQDVVAFLEGEAARLEEMSWNKPDGQEILMCRYWISMILNQYYTNAKMRQKIDYTQEDLQTLRQEITAMHEKWDYQQQ